MENQQNLALIKEQLREKERELRRREALRTKNEERVKRVLSLSEKRIENLKEVIGEQEEKIQYNQAVRAETSRKTDTADAQTKEVTVQDPKLLEEVEELKKKNQELLDKTKAEEAERKKLETEKSLLVKEYQKLKGANQSNLQTLQSDLQKVEKLSTDSRTKVEETLKEKEKLAKEKELALDLGKKLVKEKTVLLQKIKKMKDDPASVKNLQKKIAEQEKKIKESLRKSENFAKEKASLIESYEKMLFIEDSQTSQKVRRLPSEIIEELKGELANLKEEKRKFEDKLAKEKKAFEEKLKKEKDKIREELEKQTKMFKKVKAKAVDFGEEVMADDGAPGWMVTFADMVTLLLTFFILYFSISSVNLQKFKEAIIGEEDASSGLLELLDTMEIKESIEQISGLKKDVEVPEIDQVENVASDRSKIVFRVPGSSLFESGEAYLKKDARKVLEGIVDVCRQYPKYKINIQGHTDDVPISTERFPTNWELSAARATAVLRFFIDKGIEPERLTATGYADLFPLVSNETERGRAKNRRVEFVLEKEKRF